MKGAPPITIYTTSITLFFLAIITTQHLLVTASIEGEIIGDWAETFGEELWDLGQRITKAPDIKARYKGFNVRVERKDGLSLLKSAVETVGRMFTSKMDAVKCIYAMAEESAEMFNGSDAENLTYYSAKYSWINGQEKPEVPEYALNYTWMYRNMSFNIDTHFYDIAVNTSYSSVHVPTNVFDRDPVVSETIAWSESLDDVFRQNYNSDPGLSWQYFCSNTGIMRQYPALEWAEKELDDFDCRRRSWYIEAATCSKDVVILFDNSGSMTGYRNFVATFTVKAILETFSNNDFVNIMGFSNDTFDIIPCFGDRLVQATPDNLRAYNEALAELKPEGYANFTLAFVRAFELLEEYRQNRGCNRTYIGCNQAIMLITDGVPGNLTNVFDEYNREDNGTHIPVRIFTFLIGKEVTNVREIQWMACLNRGYYVHIQSLDEVQEKVLKYISVIARPLVLQEEDHPISWTHAYVDIIKTGDPKKFRIMTSAAIPLYDRRANKQNGTRNAILLGVAGTDVLVEDIDRLTLPYKLGVNGFSFIVSNNGYLLLHPELRPVYKGILKENYNSVDIVELEMIDDGRGLRQLGPEILQLRKEMIGDTEGSILGVPVLLHYDKMRRVSREKQDYYFAPLPKTPFSLGIALPHSYGNTWIKVGEEVQRNIHMGIKMENYFLGDNWKIHPKWVYCKYHYLEGHEFVTPEEELIHFLKKMEDKNWKWSEQYEEAPEEDDDGDPNLNCGRKTLDDEAYFCNKELVQLLVFDAKITYPSFDKWTFSSKEEEELFVRYNASLRFVATMSGLTRWQFVFGENMNSNASEFGDLEAETIDETWYRSAVLQHNVEADSFVYAVDHRAGQVAEDSAVTASHAVYPKDGGLTAPALVLGYQFSHRLMHERFMEITSSTEKCKDCMKTCASDERDCYVLDDSGYIIISETHNDTGRFFGEVEGTIMTSMIKNDIYQKVMVFDLQGVCFRSVQVSSDSSIFLTPIQMVKNALKWIFVKLLWTVAQFNILSKDQVDAFITFDDDDDYFDEYDWVTESEDGTFTIVTPPPPPKPRKPYSEDEDEFFNTPREPKYETKSFACDRHADLFVLQQKKFISGDGFMSYPAVNCTRPYMVKRIPHSNMVLVVVNSMHPTCYSKVHAGARPLVPEGATGPGAPCNKIDMASLPRRRLEGCYTEHPMEYEVEACGRSDKTILSITVMFICWVVMILKKYIV